MKNLLISQLLESVSALGDRITGVSIWRRIDGDVPDVIIHCRNNADLAATAVALQLAPPKLDRGSEYEFTVAHRVFTEATVKAYGEQRKLTDEERAGRGAA